MLEEVKRLRLFAVRLHKADAVLLREVALLHARDQSEPLQRAKGEGDQGLADVVTGELLALDDEHLVTVFGEDGRRAGACRAAADDEDIK